MPFARITTHAVDRYRELQPRATEKALRKALDAGREISADLVAALTGRRPPRTRGDRYVATPDYRGIFVLVPNGDVITCLRLCDEAVRILKGTGDIPETTSDSPKSLALNSRTYEDASAEPGSPRIAAMLFFGRIFHKDFTHIRCTGIPATERAAIYTQLIRDKPYETSIGSLSYRVNRYGHIEVYADSIRILAVVKVGESSGGTRGMPPELKALRACFACGIEEADTATGRWGYTKLQLHLP